MKKRLLNICLMLSVAAALLVGCGSKEETPDTPVAVTEEQGMAKESVIVAMGHGSEPEAGFDPAYGWGAGEHVHEPLIQSTLTVPTTVQNLLPENHLQSAAGNVFMGMRRVSPVSRIFIIIRTHR